MKTDNREYTKLQELTIRDLVERGVPAFCMRYSNSTGKFTIEGIEGFEWDEISSNNVLLFLKTVTKLVFREEPV